MPTSHLMTIDFIDRTHPHRQSNIEQLSTLAMITILNRLYGESYVNASGVSQATVH
jgi:hypothetical protein